MVCKNCNTAVDEQDKKCPKCGEVIKKDHKKLIITVVIGVFAIIFILYFALGGGSSPSDEIAPPLNSDLTEEENDYNNDETADEGDTSVMEEYEEQPINFNTADFTKDIEDIWSMLYDTVRAVNQYFDKYSETVSFVSRNGYFYEVPSRSYVMANDLLDLTDFPSEYEDEGILFFYIRPSDLKPYLGRDISDKTDLTIFAAYETKDGFALTAQGEIGGIIPREDLLEVLKNYQWDHGSIRKIPFESDEFYYVLQVISRYEDYEGGYDVRYMYRDDKYISVVLSKEGAHKNLQQYVLEDLQEVIVMRAANIQNTANYRVYVNTILSDFNLNLLPDYNISQFNKHIIDGFDEIVVEMLLNGIITEADLPVTFETGALDFIYLEFQSGKNFMGFYNEGTWEITIVEDYETIIDYMSHLARRPPYFIIKQY